MKTKKTTADYEKILRGVSPRRVLCIELAIMFSTFLAATTGTIAVEALFGHSVQLCTFLVCVFSLAATYLFYLWRSKLITSNPVVHVLLDVLGAPDQKLSQLRGKRIGPLSFIYEIFPYHVDTGVEVINCSEILQVASRRIEEVSNQHSGKDLYVIIDGQNVAAHFGLGLYSYFPSTVTLIEPLDGTKKKDGSNPHISIRVGEVLERAHYEESSSMCVIDVPQKTNKETCGEPIRAAFAWVKQKNIQEWMPAKIFSSSQQSNSQESYINYIGGRLHKSDDKGITQMFEATTDADQSIEKYIEVAKDLASFIYTILEKHPQRVIDLTIRVPRTIAVTAGCFLSTYIHTRHRNVSIDALQYLRIWGVVEEYVEGKPAILKPYVYIGSDSSR